MKVYLVFAIGLLLGSSFTLAAIHAAHADIDPVKQSPEYYKVRLENDRVRVLEYHLKPGQKEPMHTHVPGVVYSASASTFRVTMPDGSVTEHQAKLGDVGWRDAMSHALENTGTTEISAIAVELKGCK